MTAPAELDGFIRHGGRLAAARAAFPHAPQPWLDLSTGVNPRPYPAPRASRTERARLPDPEALRASERKQAFARLRIDRIFHRLEGVELVIARGVAHPIAVVLVLQPDEVVAERVVDRRDDLELAFGAAHRRAQPFGAFRRSGMPVRVAR